MKKAFTLLELVVVIIIIGILATLGVSQYTVARERALWNEAKANLRLILAAERITRMERDDAQYVAANMATINGSLHLLLPTSATRLWNYQVNTYTGATTNDRFCAQATRNHATIVKNFRIRSTSMTGVVDPVIEDDLLCP